MIEWFSALDPADPRPRYRQVAGQLRAAIQAEKYRPGDKLPSESQLSKIFGVSMMTVRQAARELRDEGLVYAHHGKGVFVLDRGREKEISLEDRAYRLEMGRTVVARILDEYRKIVREMIDEEPDQSHKQWLRENFLDKGIYK